MNWFLYDRDLRHERVNGQKLQRSNKIFVVYFFFIGFLSVFWIIYFQNKYDKLSIIRQKGVW